MNLKIIRNVIYTQGKNCILCLHIGSTALMIQKDSRNWIYGIRIELFTPSKLFRISAGQIRYARQARK